MIINTHILFSKIIYKYCLKELNFKLNKGIFMYGNIKPDIVCNHFKDSHTLNETKNIISEYSNQLINSKSSIKQFSLHLGIICHYICDSFCLYHTEEYKDKNIFMHLLYEIIIHLLVLTLFISGKLKFDINKNLLQRDILSIIYKMKKEYFQKRKSFIKDITYAILTTIAITESIIYFSINKSENYVEKNTEIYELSKVIGGIV